MNKQEWLDIGYEKGIIDIEDYEEITFCNAYKEWLQMKIACIKPQSCDRIEVTYLRYYYGNPLIEKCISKITESDIIDFLTCCIIKYGNISYKEFGRILQIMRGVLVYMKDLKKGGATLYDWDKIKRYIPYDKLDNSYKKEFAISKADIEKIMEHVIDYNIYPLKRNGCLCLCMNFFLGLRIGELSALTFNDFDFERNVVKIYKTESKFYNRDEDGSKLGTMVYRVVDNCKTVYSVREVPLLPEVVYIYNLIKQNHACCGYDSEYLAYDGSDTILVRSLDRTLRKLCILCDVPYFHSHEIRKTFVTMLHYSGVPTRVISDLVGHSEIGTTENSYILSYADKYSSMYDYMKNGINIRLNKK